MTPLVRQALSSATEEGPFQPSGTTRAMLLEPGFLIVQTLNGLQLSMLLFLLSIGLSVVFGLMNFINLAHGTLYMLGAYLGLSAVRWFDSFWVALVLAPAGVALIGAVFYAVLLRHMQRQSPMRQVLVTFGLIFVGFDTVRMVWGTLPHVIPVRRSWRAACTSSARCIRPTGCSSSRSASW